MFFNRCAPDSRMTLPTNDRSDPRATKDSVCVIPKTDPCLKNQRIVTKRRNLAKSLLTLPHNPGGVTQMQSGVTTVLQRMHHRINKQWRTARHTPTSLNAESYTNSLREHAYQHHQPHSRPGQTTPCAPAHHYRPGGK